MYSTLIGSTIRRFAGLVAVGLLSACQGTPSPAPLTEYHCADGRRFAAAYAADGKTAQVVVDGMHFQLQREAGGERYQCSELSLERTADGARLQFAGAPRPAACHPAR
ncbi:MAG: hypothetical protein KDH20_09360 [Rhodocyclaceae bacterium]|nr:hypothetical protein [Rhodocyclaceae bacterium]